MTTWKLPDEKCNRSVIHFQEKLISKFISNDVSRCEKVVAPFLL